MIAPVSHVVYQVGKSDWALDWAGKQRPGSLYDIHFDLNAAPRGVFLLKACACHLSKEPGSADSNQWAQDAGRLPGYKSSGMFLEQPNARS
jgi:hypothetical protein